MYGYESFSKSKILSAIVFIQDNWFGIIIHESFYNKFQRVVKGDITKREEIIKFLD
jgi:hypothetical protein